MAAAADDADGLASFRALVAAGTLNNPDLFTEEVVIKVQRILDDAQNMGTLVAAWDSIQDILIEAKLAWYAQMQPDFVGVHEQNRSKFGVAGADSHAHGDQIIIAGFSWRKASDATAIEADPQDAEARAFNDCLVALSDGLIPMLTMLKLVSVGSSHTNVFLRALKARSRTCIERLQDSAGRLDTDQICLRHPKLKEAVDHGLKWLVIHRDAPKVWTTLVTLIQSALNTEARGGQSEVEVMLSMNGMMESAVKANQKPDWKRITQAAAYSLPACTPWINVLADFVKNSGGAGELLMDLSAFQKASFQKAGESSKRVLGSVFYHKIGLMNFGIGVKCPFVQTALVKANLASPINKVVDNLCQLIQPAHIASLTSKQNRAKSIEIDGIMSEARNLVNGLSMEHEAKIRTLGQLDVRLVTHVLKLGKASEGHEYKNVGEIVQVRIANAWMCCSTPPHQCIQLMLILCSIVLCLFIYLCVSM